MSNPRQWRASYRDDEEEGEEESEVQSSQRETSERTSGESSGFSQQRSDRSSVGPPPSYDGDRKPGAWEDYRLRARLWLRTTTIAETSRGPRMLQQLSGKAFDTMKYLAEDDDWFNDSRNGQLLLEEMGRPDRFGKEEIESLWNSLHRLLYSKLKLADDDILSFRNRFEEANRKVKKHGVNLPAEALGFIYLRQAQVDDLTLERIVTLTKGDLTLEAVIDAMRKLKMRLIQNDDDKKKSHVWFQQASEHEDGGPGLEIISEHSALLNSVEDEEMEALESALRDLEDHGDEDQISEVDAKDILMTLIRQKVNRPVQQLSYKQVQNMKNELKTGRGFRTSPGNQYSGAKRDIQHLKSITKCRTCGMTGHWHRECPQKNQRSSQSNASAAGSSAPPQRDGDVSNKAWWSLSESMEQECLTTSELRE